MRVGVTMFIIFAAFFEGLVFRSFAFSSYILPVGLIVIGFYLVLKRSGLFFRKEESLASSNISEEK